ncbi:3'-5' exoribonuclease YhaM [bacterium HR17]|uniref:3'-5' exoribonuclease YhaM n=1 Tax=Candidatus Fervidibacter japonicus TaxID=2035412 RepID=A0A2H5X9J7_9BACT|nr:3'-5' exoribonuclease YhaM [bacterium HR17]
MAKAQYLADLRVGDYVDTIVLVKSKRLIPYRTRPGCYLVLTLKDRSGTVEGRVWDDAERIDREIGDCKVVRVRGLVELFQQIPQVRVVSVEPVAEGEYDWADLLPRTEKEVEALWARVQSAVDSVVNPHLQALLRAFFDDPVFAEAFQNAPASLYLHHSWVGGLLEHTCTVLDLAEALCRHYPEIDRDLLITGVLLHDVGKVREYTWQPDIDRTDEGRLLGHLVLGDEMVAERLKGIPNFPAELAMRVRHMLISHHGTGEWGSPRPPMTLEAAALHFLEFADAQLRKFATLLKDRREPERAWTGYDRVLGRRLFAGYGTAETASSAPIPMESQQEDAPIALAEPTDAPLPVPEPVALDADELVAEVPEMPSDLLQEKADIVAEPEEPTRRRRLRRAEATDEEGKLPL